MRSKLAPLVLGFFIAGAAAAAPAPAPLQWPALTESATDIHTPGRWAWVDLFTDDVGTAERFYGRVFGWTFERYGDDKRVYALARSNGQRVAGIAYIEKAKASTRASRWVGLLSVPDVDKAANYVGASGGKVLLSPRNLPGRGTAALLSDPEGAPFGVIRASGGDPPDELGDDNTWLWGELWAKDPQAMAEFYRGLEVFVPQREGSADNPTEFLLMAGGYPRAGIIHTPRDTIPSTWLPYIRVANLGETLARVTQAGGRVVLAPNPAIRGGRIAICVDPVGAPLGVAEWSDADDPRQSP